MSDNEKLYCPDCGIQRLEVIETTELDPAGEYKVICTCPECDNLVYLIKGLHNTDLYVEPPADA